jgi:hypothetical protein
MSWTTWCWLLEQRCVEVGEQCVDAVAELFVVAGVIVSPRWRGMGHKVLETVKHAVERRLHLVDRGRAHHKLLLHGGSWAWRRWNTETSGIGTDQACSPAGLASRSSLAASAAAFLMKSSFGRVLTCRRWRVCAAAA